MDMVEVHKQARANQALICFHEFKSTYRKTDKIIYAFCEGKDDLSFYRNAIEEGLNDGWNVHMWEVGGVDNVIELYSKFDWRSYVQSQIIFFIDRDLTEFTGVRLPNKKNIYITDNYSIENDVVNWNTCERILTEVLGFNSLSLAQKAEISKVFMTELAKFIVKMVPIMAWIVHWRKCEKKAYLNEIRMDHLFNIQKCRLKSVANLKRCKDIIEYIHKQCKLNVDQQYDLTAGCAEFCKDNRHKRFTRGKYLIWFLVEFCLSIHRDYLELPGLQLISKSKNKVNFSNSNAIVLISSRFRLPSSLKDFISNTVKSFVKLRETA